MQVCTVQVFFYVFVLHTVLCCVHYVYCVVCTMCIALCIVLCCISLPLFANFDYMKIKHNHNDNLSGWVLK